MAVWRYVALPVSNGGPPQRGEFTGESGADVRAALRRAGLQVIDLRPVRDWSSRAHQDPWLMEVTDRWWKHLRSRRRAAVGELYDSIATMLESGLPILESIETIATSIRGKRSSLRTMLMSVRESLRSGQPLSGAMENFRGWFGPLEVAMVRAGQQSGELAATLRRLSDRHERSHQLGQKLLSALAYPAVITLVGIGVVLFLSTHTLPNLVRVLQDAEVQTPALTATIIGMGGFAVQRWPLILLILLVLPLLSIFLIPRLSQLGGNLPWLQRVQGRLVPKVFDRLILAGFALRLAELVRSGIPVVEALRIVAPAVGSAALRRVIIDSADRVEQGEELSEALHDDRWFDAEFRQMLALGQASGDIDVLLTRLGDRYARQATRLIDRLAALLEPAVILVLAFLVGLVVMAAILPLVQLQEVF